MNENSTPTGSKTCDSSCDALTPTQQIILMCLLGPEDPNGWATFFRQTEHENYRGARQKALKACPPEMKRCVKCRLVKTKGKFSKGTNNADGLNSYCKPCSSSNAKKSRFRNLEKVREREQARNKSATHRGERLLCAYGITLEEYNRLLSEQGGVCAICKKEEVSKKKKNLTVDHDHVTGRVRGLLCHLCNAGLGLFRDSAELTQVATEYLVRARQHFL